MKVDDKLYCVLATCFIANAMFMVPVSFLPDFLEERKVDSSVIGLIFMCHGISMIVVSPLTGLVVNSVGHASLVSIACLIKSFVFVGYSMTNKIHDHDLLVMSYIVLELLEGTAMAMIDVSSYTFLSKRYPNQTEQAISLYETCDAISFIMGILVGAVLYDVFGFSTTFIIFASLMFPLSIINCVMFRNIEHIEVGMRMRSDSDNGSGIVKRAADPQKQMGYFDLLRKPRILFAAINFGVIQFSIEVFEPTLALRLEDYNTSITVDGLIIAISPIFMTISTYFSSYILPSSMEFRVILISSTFLTGVFTTFIGPFYAERDLVMMCVGLIICGLFRGSAFAFSLSEMIDCVGDVKHSNLLSGILFMSFGIGGTIGPGLGGLLYDYLGFRWMCNIDGIICIAFSILYFICADGYSAFRRMLCQK